MSENPNPHEIRKLPTSLEEDNEKKNKRRDFWIGMIGSIVLNLVIGGLFVLTFAFLINPNGISVPNYINETAVVLVYILPWALNIAAIIIALVMRRPAIALGILASYALAFVLALIAGLIFMAICFVQIGGISV
jgi:hypothetical protein